MSGDLHTKIWLLLVALATAGMASFWYGFRAWRENRLVADTPASRVRSAAFRFVFRQLGDEAFGRQHQAGDARRVL